MERFEVTSLHGVIHVSGEIDPSTAPLINAAVAAAEGDLLLDLRRCTFIDSTGITALIEADSLAQRHGNRMVLISPSSPVVRVLDICGMSETFVIKNDDTGTD